MVVLLLSIGVLFTFILWFLLFILPTKWLKVEEIKWQTKSKKKILQISDLHIRHLRVSFHTIEKLILKESPDYIFLTGDFIDRDAKEFEQVKKFLQIIENTKIETFAVLGNHDRYIEEEKVKELEKLFHECHIQLLKNQFVEKEDMFIVGIDDYCKGHCNIEESFNFNNSSGKDVLVLTHDPDALFEITEPFSMFVSGHYHGKQVNIPFLFKVKHMGILAQQGMYKGKHFHPKGTIYISKGIGQTKFNIRFLVRSEVTMHYLGE